MHPFEGTYTALVTPFIGERVDENSLKKLIDYQIEKGIDGLVPCGTTGESATLSHEEHAQVMELTVRHVAGRVPVLVGSGSNSTAESISLTQGAAALGADGALVISPYYNKPTQEGIYRHFAAVAGAVDIPIVVYNVPGRTSSDILPETVARLAQIDNIVGIKEATGSLERLSTVVQQCPADFAVLSGDDPTSLAAVLLGAAGVISVTSNVEPGAMSAMIRAGRAGDVENARQMHYQLFDLMQTLFLETNPIPVKAALKMKNVIEDGTPRLPLCALSDGPARRLKEVLDRLATS